jgi:hypothetical protein
MNVYLCVSIDCECDKGPGWRTRKPLAFTAVTLGIKDRLQPLFRQFRAKPTYLLSPEVVRDAASLDALAVLDGEAELGTHLHAEFAEPEAFEPEVTSAIQSRYDRETERQKLGYLTRLFEGAFGHPPRSFRAGRFGIGRHSLGLLQELGYAVDSSVTPHKDWTRIGAPEAAFRNAPTQPYWPVLDDPAVAADAPGSLLEVPVTIRPGRFGRLLGRWIEPYWLRPTRTGAARLIGIAREEIAEARPAGRPIVLNCMFHNVEVVAGASPYAATDAEALAIMERLSALLAWAERESIRCIGLGDVPELFDP